jgi:hypothetical protein
MISPSPAVPAHTCVSTTAPRQTSLWFVPRKARMLPGALVAVPSLDDSLCLPFSNIAVKLCVYGALVSSHTELTQSQCDQHFWWEARA